MNDKQHLLALLSSRDNERAIQASELLAAKGWLKDGSLRGATLSGANLYGAFLYEVDLHLADFSGADLRVAYLVKSNLAEANFHSADLQEAYLIEADLRGTDFTNANLLGVKLHGAQFDSSTILPNCGRWEPRYDLRMFTDSEHPAFASYASNERWYELLYKRLMASAAATHPDAINDLTIEDLEDAWHVSEGKCHYCQRKLNQYGSDGWCIDHKVASSRKGANTRSNIVICCRPCNSAKSDYISYERFLARMQEQKRYKQHELWANESEDLEAGD